MARSAAAVAGGAYIWSFRYIDPRTVFGLDVALIPVAMALLGGSGLLWGPLIGAVLLSVGIQLLIVNLTMLQFTIIGLAILLIGRYMPGGLLRARWVQRVPLLAPLGHEHHERIAATAAAVMPDASGVLPLERIAADRSRVLLATRDLTMAFGGNVAVNRVNLEVREGEILGLIGPNGSGKTTLFNCLSKVYEPVSGDIMFAGQSLRGLRRDHRVPAPDRPDLSNSAAVRRSDGAGKRGHAADVPRRKSPRPAAGAGRSRAVSQPSPGLATSSPNAPTA